MLLAEPFVVKVVDAYDDPVEDVQVRFRTTQAVGVYRLARYARIRTVSLRRFSRRPLPDASSGRDCRGC